MRRLHLHMKGARKLQEIMDGALRLPRTYWIYYARRRACTNITSKYICHLLPAMNLHHLECIVSQGIKCCTELRCILAECFQELWKVGFKLRRKKKLFQIEWVSRRKSRNRTQSSVEKKLLDVQVLLSSFAHYHFTSRLLFWLCFLFSPAVTCHRRSSFSMAMGTEQKLCCYRVHRLEIVVSKKANLQGIIGIRSPLTAKLFIWHSTRTLPALPGICVRTVLRLGQICKWWLAAP